MWTLALTLNLATATSLQPMAVQNSVVSFQSRFEPIGKVIERLSGESRVPMLAQGSLAETPIYINVRDVTLSDLMNRIATVAGAEWKQKENNWFLSCDQSLQKQQEKAGDALLISSIDATINAKLPTPKSEKEMEMELKSIEKNPEAAMAMITNLFGQATGLDEGTQTLLKLIGAKDLSTLIEGRRVVLSSSPTPMQGLMNSKAINGIKDFIKKEAKKSNQKKEGDLSDISGGLMSMFGGNGMLKPELVNRMTTVMATFQISHRESLKVEIGAYTDEGIGIYRKSAQLQLFNPESLTPKVTGTTPLIIPAEAKLYARALTDGEKIDPFLKMLTGFNGSIMSLFTIGTDMMNPNKQPAPTLQPLDGSVRARLMKPNQFDPIGQILAPVVDAEASRGRNVVALPSDAVFKVLAETYESDNLKLEEVLDTIDRTQSQEVTRDGQWTLIHASSPMELRSAFCNRAALTQLIQNGASKGYLNLDDCARFAVTQDQARGSELIALPMISAIFRTSDLGSAGSLTTYGFDTLKFYASLTEFQKRTLNAKNPLSLATLSPIQREIVGRMVYFGPSGPMAADNPMAALMSMPAESTSDSEEIGAAGAMMGIGMQFAEALTSLFSGDLKLNTERTVMLPNGIPVVGTIELQTYKSNALLAEDPTSGLRSIAIPEMIAATESDQFMGMMSGALAGPKRNFTQYQMAKQQTFMLNFKFGTGSTFITSLYDVSVDTSKKFTKDQLPAAMQKRLVPPTIPNIGRPANIPPL